MNDDQRKNEGLVRRGVSTGTSDRDDSGDQEQGNPLLALSRLSKALAPYYLGICFVFSSLGGVVVVYSKITKNLSSQIQSEIKDATQVPFHDLGLTIEKVDKLEGRVLDIERVIQPPIDQPPRYYQKKGRKP